MQQGKCPAGRATDLQPAGGVQDQRAGRSCNSCSYARYACSCLWWSDGWSDGRSSSGPGKAAVSQNVLVAVCKGLLKAAHRRIDRSCHVLPSPSLCWSLLLPTGSVNPGGGGMSVFGRFGCPFSSCGVTCRGNLRGRCDKLLEHARQLQIEEVVIQGDCINVVKHFAGCIRLHREDLVRKLNAMWQKITHTHIRVHWSYVPRAGNKVADHLAGIAADSLRLEAPALSPG